MPKISARNGNGTRSGATKYDAHHKVLSQTYGAFSPTSVGNCPSSKNTVTEREDILRGFARVAPIRNALAWLLPEDYFENCRCRARISPATDW